MNIDKVAELTYHIITEYYKNNLKPFFEYLDENILWFGPAEKQILKTKQAMLDAWAKEQNELTFTVGDVIVYKIPLTKKSCDIIITYPVYTHYPDGVTHLHNQRMDCLWMEKTIDSTDGQSETVSRIVRMNISNSIRMHDEDFVYAVHSEHSNVGQLNYPHGSHITFKGKNNMVYHFLSDSILWIEKSDAGRHSIVHTVNEDFLSVEGTNYFNKEYPSLFFAPHISYLVNPLHIRSVERLKITLDNDTELPIPEKKYTKFKSDFVKWSENQKE